MKKLVPTKRWHQHHTVPSQGTVNSMVLNRNTNGLAAHIVRLNNRLYIIEDEFFEWLLSHRESSKSELKLQIVEGGNRGTKKIQNENERKEA